MYNVHVKPMGKIVQCGNGHNTQYEYILSSISPDAQYEFYYIISPANFFHEANGLASMMYIDQQIPDDILLKTKNRQCLIIVDFSYEANGLYSESLHNKGERNWNSHEIDVYTSTCKYAEQHDINECIKFISMMQNAEQYVISNFYNRDIARYKRSVQVYACPSVPTRYKHFEYDEWEHLLNVDGPIKNGIWLNRRIREHRVGLIAECVNKSIDFDKFNFSFIGSRFESYEVSSSELDKEAILLNQKVNDTNNEKVLNLFGRTVGLDTSKSPEELDQWLATSDIGRLVEMHKIRSNSAYEIVSEFTHNDIGVHFSEKFTLPILSKKPFVVSGDRHIISELQNLGFKTFSDFWPEDYDDMAEFEGGRETRTESLAKTIRYIEDTFHNLDNYSRDEYGNVIYNNKIRDILEHNYNHFHNVFYPKIIAQWQDIFSKNTKIPPLLGMHPREAEVLVTRDETWEDSVWYNNDTHHIFIPIWRNGNTFFHKICAESFGYRLVKKKDLKDWRNIPAYAFLRLPEKRITGQLWRAFKNSNITPTMLQNTEDWSKLDMHLVPQCEFLKDFNLVCTINIDTEILNYTSSTNNDISLVIDKVFDCVTTIKRELNSSAQDPEFLDYVQDIMEQQWFKIKHQEYYEKDFKLLEVEYDDRL